MTPTLLRQAQNSARTVIMTVTFLLGLLACCAPTWAGFEPRSDSSDSSKVESHALRAIQAEREQSMEESWKRFQENIEKLSAISATAAGYAGQAPGPLNGAAGPVGVAEPGEESAEEEVIPEAPPLAKDPPVFLEEEDWREYGEYGEYGPPMTSEEEEACVEYYVELIKNSVSPGVDLSKGTQVVQGLLGLLTSGHVLAEWASQAGVSEEDLTPPPQQGAAGGGAGMQANGNNGNPNPAVQSGISAINKLLDSVGNLTKYPPSPSPALYWHYINIYEEYDKIVKYIATGDANGMKETLQRLKETHVLVKKELGVVAKEMEKLLAAVRQRLTPIEKKLSDLQGKMDRYEDYRLYLKGYFREHGDWNIAPYNSDPRYNDRVAKSIDAENKLQATESILEKLQKEKTELQVEGSRWASVYYKVRPFERTLENADRRMGALIVGIEESMNGWPNGDWMEGYRKKFEDLIKHREEYDAINQRRAELGESKWSEQRWQKTIEWNHAVLQLGYALENDLNGEMSPLVAKIAKMMRAMIELDKTYSKLELVVVSWRLYLRDPTFRELIDGIRARAAKKGYNLDPWDGAGDDLAP